MTVEERQFNWRIPGSLVTDFQRLCGKRGYQKKAQVVRMVQDWIDREEGKQQAIPLPPELEESVGICAAQMGLGRKLTPQVIEKILEDWLKRLSAGVKEEVERQRRSSKGPRRGPGAG